MEVFAFADGELVTLQGNVQGTHFFIVAEGTLTILRDGAMRNEITQGAAFGESVILLSGAQNATVRSKGSSRVYGVTGHAIRRTLRNRYQKDRKRASKLINDLLGAGQCTLLHNLSPYQTQCLFDKCGMSCFVRGDVLMKEGEAVNTLHVLVQGSLSLSVKGNRLEPPGAFGIIGEMGLLYTKADATAITQEPSQTLTLTRELLRDMFGDKLEEELLRSCLLGRLVQHGLFAGLSMEQLDVIAGLCQILELPAEAELEEQEVYFMMCIHGRVEVEASVPGTGPGNKKQELSGITGDSLGEECVTQENVPWMLRVRSAAGTTDAVKFAIWKNTGLGEFLKQKSRLEAAATRHADSPMNNRPSFKKLTSMRMAVWQDDKEAALRKVVVLRTLSSEQLRQLAAALEVQYVAAGETVFSQGEEGKDFYIIHTGQLSVKIGDRHVRTLGMGDYVGERALLFSEPRSATITVVEDSELWKMNKEAFMDVVKGPILDYMKDRIAFQNTKVELDSLICLRIIGRGGFGVVKMVQLPTTSTRYALKCVNKRQAVAQKQQKALALERSILAELDHPFVIKFIRSFLGKHYVYFLMELVTGGELLDALDSLGLLKKPQAQFYSGSIILALEFLHERRIAYLDIKGENCLIDQHGYLKIIDFGIAERLRGGRIYAVKGTPLFMAPEVILGKGYNCSADLWSLGICLYDFMVGRFPFGSDTASNPEIFRAVLKSPLKLPKGIEREEATKQILMGLLTRDPTKRLGAGPEGYDAIKQHPFFSDFRWDELLSRQLSAPYLPKRETYAEDQENPNTEKASAHTNPRMTSAGFATCEGDEADDTWADPDPSWQEHF
uniref:cGMP-dependent protein kinase n=1 Tax=Pyrodinium bahamense TaxID=73915 RepID=A0A7S0A147_9DINO